MKRKAEGLIIAVQNQVLPTRNYKAKIIKENGLPKYKIHGTKDGTVMYILSECEKLVQIEYRKRRDQVVKCIDSNGVKNGTEQNMF